MHKWYDASTLIDANLEAGRGDRPALWSGNERIETVRIQRSLLYVRKVNLQKGAEETKEESNLLGF
jgi:hypothetical protein